MPVSRGRNAFLSSSRTRMGSNAITTQNQGGGNTKAGFPYQVGRSSWSSVRLGFDPTSKSGCATLRCMQFTVNPRVSESRSIGSTAATNRYFHIPGAGQP
uniref:Uncharacterized protein n=1 Tax=viral metagenome TaxID=1070528 RepID=A0A6C0JL01_9ZZZZ